MKVNMGKINLFMRSFILLITLVIVSISHGFAQDLQDIKRQYPFIKIVSNKLQNDGTALDSFYTHLLQLKTNRNNTVRLTHIGDSHLQADLFSGKVREQMQLTYGNAGRGLVVPYKVGCTNEPYTYKTSSNNVWKSKRNIAIADSMPTGVGGLTLKTEEMNASIQITVGNKPNLNYQFNNVTLFHEKCFNCFDFEITDSCGGATGMVSSLPSADKKFHSEVALLNYENTIGLHTRLRTFTHPSFTMIYGLVLENSRPGILYNTIGINGAEYRHYNKSLYFQEQQKVLKPNLIIISLGTNEAFSRSFDPAIFKSQVDTLITALKINNPQASLLVTIPGDHFRSRKYKNNNIPIARNVLIDYCSANNIAYWDLFEIMGGFGSIAKWNAKNLTSKDLLHLNRKGYELQGELLFQAIISGFSKFELRRPQ